MSTQRGFTLVELMATLAVASILLSAVAVSYAGMIGRGSRDAALGELSFTLSLARSEAIKRSATVSVCPSNDASSCSGGWSDGWLMFVNTDADAPPAIDSGETVLRGYTNGRNGYNLIASASLQSGVSFRGRGTPAASGSLIMCANDVATPTTLSLTPIGIPEIASGGSCP